MTTIPQNINNQNLPPWFHFIHNTWKSVVEDAYGKVRANSQTFQATWYTFWSHWPFSFSLHYVGECSCVFARGRCIVSSRLVYSTLCICLNPQSLCESCNRHLQRSVRMAYRKKVSSERTSLFPRRSPLSP